MEFETLAGLHKYSMASGHDLIVYVLVERCNGHVRFDVLSSLLKIQVF